jgi:hypothetical protein
MQRGRFPRDVNDHRHLQQDALRAAALFSGLRTGNGGAALYIVSGSDGRRSV